LSFWLYEKSELNSRSKWLPSAPEPATAAESAKSATTTEAITTESASTAPAIEAAALKILEPLA
jgi:hypothetical protein